MPPLSGLLIIPLALIVLSIIVFIHELGHFIAAKKLGVWVEEFGLGLPPRIWGKKIGDTVYSLNALPIGGFVRLHGETLDEAAKYPNWSFVNKGKIPRIIISLAGIFMNFVLAVVCFSLVYSITGIVQEGGDVKVTNIAPASPAQVVGILTEDVLKKINKEDVVSVEQFIEIVGQSKGKKITIEVERTVGDAKETKKFTVTPRENPPEGEGSLGVTIALEPIVYYPPLWKRPFVGAYHGIKTTLAFSRDVVLGFAQISKQVSQGEAPKGVVGPVGIGAIIIEVIRQGIIPVVNLVGIISLNLAIFNLIPFPPLDGSRVLFVAVEAFLGKKILPRVEFWAHSIGMALLILLLIAISGREIPKLLRAGSISGFVDSLVK